METCCRDFIASGQTGAYSVSRLRIGLLRLYYARLCIVGVWFGSCNLRSSYCGFNWSNSTRQRSTCKGVVFMCRALSLGWSEFFRLIRCLARNIDYGI